MILLAAASPAVQIATDAQDKVQAVSGPIIGLGVALLLLTLAVLVIAYINSKLPSNG